ncbi:MAG: alpha-ketoacid dehydrogenase subunit beta [Candidatus Nanopelagicaceae bacterium]
MLTMAEAVREAMTIAMEERPEVFLMGEDVGIYGGAFGVSAGMFEKFGADRVIDTPISELGYIGAAVGAALSGMRPIAEIQFSDFSAQAMDQIANQAAKIHFMLGGALHVPMVIRAPQGSGTGAAAQHSQIVENWFTNVPGLKVVVPSNPSDAKGLLLSAIDDPNPVVFLEHKLLYKTPGWEAVPEGNTRIPLGVSRVIRTGKDLTVVATGIMVMKALEAAEKLASEGIELTVIDPRTISPLDMTTTFDSVTSTGRLLVVQEGPSHGGFINEIVAQVAGSHVFGSLKAPIKKLAGLNIPIPYAPQLEKAAVPQVEDIYAAAVEIVRQWR